jgi:DNA polymerase I-like protein with 3'-5' exonuclease and polymerase domains
MIVEARETNKTHGTFLQPYLEFSAKTGRIHPHVNQMRSDDGGTVTGRLSMANPNLQQVPARHEIIGPMVRNLFLPEEKVSFGHLMTLVLRNLDCLSTMRASWICRGPM